MLFLLLLGCPPATDAPADKTPETDDTAIPTVDPATVPLGGVCDLADDYGGFVVSSEVDATNVTGTVTDGVVPFTVLEEIAAEGDCHVLRRNNPFCDPACDAGQACDFDGTCVDYPSNQDLGTVTLRGLGDPVVMEPVFPGNTYYDTSHGPGVIAAGELLTLSMPGGVYGPLDLYGVGVEDLDMTGVVWEVEGGVDLTVTWPAPTASLVRSEVAIQLSIDQHGVTPSVLRCTFEDDGEGTVSGSLVASLVDVGVTGFPAGTIERRTADSGPAGSGCMDFVVSSPRTVDVDVVGHTPCTDTAECPDGQTCDEELQTCE